MEDRTDARKFGVDHVQSNEHDFDKNGFSSITTNQMRYEKGLSVSECHATFLSALPRELRDKVYSYCVQGDVDNDIVVVPRPNSGGDFALLARKYSESSRIEWQEEGTWSCMDSQLMGLQFAQEMAEAYYRTKHFRFAHDGHEIIKTFLCTDFLGCGIVAANFAKRLELQIQPYSRAWRPVDSATSNQERRRRGLRALEHFQSCGGVVAFLVDLAYNSDGLDDTCSSGLADAIDALTPIIGDLKARGLRPELSISDCWDQRHPWRILDSPQYPIEQCLVDVKDRNASTSTETDVTTLFPTLNKTVYST